MYRPTPGIGGGGGGGGPPKTHTDRDRHMCEGEKKCAVEIAVTFEKLIILLISYENVLIKKKNYSVDFMPFLQKHI